MGIEIALFEVDHRYGALRLNGAPFGAAVVPPSHGTWDHIAAKFPSWEKGAGKFPEISCNAASASATDLVANEDAMRTLKMFDLVIDSLFQSFQGVEDLKTLF